MDRMTLRVVLVSLLWLMGSAPGWGLDSRTENDVRGATFEFFAPGKDSRSKGLVGTAFAIGPNEFATAAHLVNGLIGSRFERPVLIDERGVRYRIADVLKFSEERDYVTFSLEHPPRIKALAARAQGQPASTEVYFAGWTASGKISIKTGTYSGFTPAQESAQPAGFDWLRFNGSVWGGVGGGPLVDGAGQVVGIVQGTDRLGGANFAVPIALVSNPSASDQGQLHGIDLLRSLMPAVVKTEPLNAEIPLPMPFDNFQQEVQKLRLAYFDQLVGPLLEATRRSFVLRGDAAESACNFLNGDHCMCKPRREVSGELIVNDIAEEATQPTNETSLHAQSFAGANLIRTAKGHSKDSDPLANQALHLALARMGPVRSDVRLDSAALIKSATSAPADRDYADFHGRTWHERTWPLLDRDVEVMSMVREVPDGYVVVTRIVPTALDYAADLQLKFIANLIYYQCDESLAEGVASLAKASPARKNPGTG